MSDVSDPVPEKSPAEIAKDAGNSFFKEGHYAEAVVKYNEAIDLDPEKPAFYTNRSFCHLKMENHGLAIADATVAIELDKTFVKAYHRRGSAYMALAQFKSALKDFKAAKQLKPNDRDVLEKFKAADKEVKRQAFEKAIHTDEKTEPLLCETLEADTMAVDSSYDGPQPSMPMTRDDVIAIAEHMKQQKSLHTKYVYRILISLRKILAGEKAAVAARAQTGSAEGSGVLEEKTSKLRASNCAKGELPRPFPHARTHAVTLSLSLTRRSLSRSLSLALTLSLARSPALSSLAISRRATDVRRRADPQRRPRQRLRRHTRPILRLAQHLPDQRMAFSGGDDVSSPLLSSPLLSFPPTPQVPSSSL